MEEEKRRRWLTPGRLLDVLAILVIAFVVWKIFIAPRAFKGADAYPAPRIAYQKLDGGTFRVSDAKGRVLFLDFFASWCEPCKLQMPMVEKYARTHPNVMVVPIDVGEPRPVVERFAKSFKLTNVALDPTSSAQGFFQIQGFPTIVVVDPQGKIRATWSGFNPAISMAMSNAEKELQ
jgi:thiol-disulfide isomerase/thioredoxin